MGPGLKKGGHGARFATQGPQPAQLAESQLAYARVKLGRNLIACGSAQSGRLGTCPRTLLLPSDYTRVYDMPARSESKGEYHDDGNHQRI